MPETPQQTLARLQRELPLRRRQEAQLRARLIAVRRRIASVIRGIAIHKVSARQQAVRWALAQVGTIEHPPGSNSGPKISGWIRAGGGQPGWSWCQYFADAVAVHGGCRQIIDGYTVDVMRGAYARLGYRPIKVAEALPGDMIFFKFPGISSDPCDHVGIKLDGNRTVEGNTSSDRAGSQSNGGGVFVRDNHMQFAVGAVRVPYKS
ncbi:MAG TPA: hypothetical protein VFF79_12740 [Conexibacter sp.]|jgi:hypothetical protein|nr:hypothetical protein [Conexibacter sp.]